MDEKKWRLCRSVMDVNIPKMVCKIFLVKQMTDKGKGPKIYSVVFDK